MSFDNSNSDSVLADKLKRENCEQFHTLVRMHLSFVLDLHTDENDCISDKTKFKKWSLFPKKTKCRGVMEGAPLTQEGICQVYQLIEFLSKETNLVQEGIFRRTGSLSRQQELRNLLNTGTTLDLNSSPFSVHDCASVLKSFLAELPEPLLTDAHYPAHCQIAELCGGCNKNSTNEPRLLRSLQLLLLLLPAENRVLLKDVLELLNLVASYESKNKMSADSLATLFTPHLLCPRKLTPEALHTNSQTMAPIVSFMITKAKKLFDIPPKLATDIRAYFLEREKRKILSPTKDLNESVSDSTAANTVYTFVDRERTAEAHVANPTEAALAQLYAHIQSLPESSKKKKLIKQFNKENGQGTPTLQFRYQKKDFRSTKSLGDSIKKHIFQKSLARNVKKTSLLLTPATTNCLNGTKSSSSEGEMLNTPDKYNSINSKCTSKYLNKLESKTENSTNSSKSEIIRLNPDTETVDSNCSTNSENGVKSLRFSNETQTFKPLDSENKSIDDQNRSLSNDKLLIDQNKSLNEVENRSEEDLDYERLDKSLVREKNVLNYLTSTPASTWLSKTDSTNQLFTPNIIGRKSMSPITRSTHRMSKAMQETMMTPRSRKPVLLISGTNICQLASVNKPKMNISEFNETILETTVDENTSKTNSSESKSECNLKNQTFNNYSEENLSQLSDDSSFEDMSKDDLSSSENSKQNEHFSENVKILTDDSSFQDMSKDNLSSDSGGNSKSKIKNSTDDSGSCLSNNFREYLLRRSVLTSPVDSSFSSREGDFESLPEEFTKTDHLSNSLLYCLDGNNPDEDSSPSRKRNFNETGGNNVVDESGYTNEKHLTLKLRKLSQTGDIVYETSL